MLACRLVLGLHGLGQNTAGLLDCLSAARKPA